MRRGLWLLTPLLLLALLYASLPALASFFVVRWLESRGFDAPQLVLEYPGFRELRVPRLTLGQHRDGRRIELSAGAIEIGYDLPTLLLERRLSHLRVPQLEVQVTETGPREAGVTPIDLSALMPAAWLALAPAEQIQVGQLQLEYRAPQQPVRRLAGNIALQAGTLRSRLQLFEDGVSRARGDLTLDTDRFALTLLEDNRPVYRTEGTLHPDNGRLQIDFEQQLALAPAQRWQRRWLPLTTELSPIDGELTGSGRLSLPLQLVPGARDWWQQLELDQQLSGTVSLQPSGATFKRLQLPLEARLQLQGTRLQLSLPAGSEARLDGFEVASLAPADARLRLLSPLTLEADLPPLPESLQLTPLQLEISSEPLQHPQGRLELSPVSFRLDSIDLQQPGASGQLRLERIRWQQGEQAFPAAALSSDFDVADGRISARFQLTFDDPALNLSGRGSSRLSPLEGNLYWQARPLSLQHAERLWNRYYPPAPPELTVSGGQLYLEGSADWAPGGLALRIDQRLEQLSAQWREIRLDGGHWQARTLRRRDGRLDQQGRLQLARLDVGFPIDAIRTAYHFRQGPQQAAELQLEPLQAQLLGGTLSTDSVTINPLSPKLDTRVRLAGLELAQLLALQQQPGLAGDGRLSGTLPLSWNERGLYIDKGHVANKGPGHIRFEPEAGVAALGHSNPGLQMAMQALSNFHYELLAVDLQYTPDGSTLMNTRLKGHNPDWNRGRAVDFNINIEQNLLKLLQALQFTGKLTDSIEKRYR